MLAYTQLGMDKSTLIAKLNTSLIPGVVTKAPSVMDPAFPGGGGSGYGAISSGKSNAFLHIVLGLAAAGGAYYVATKRLK